MPRRHGQPDRRRHERRPEERQPDRPEHEVHERPSPARRRRPRTPPELDRAASARARWRCSCGRRSRDAAPGSARTGMRRRTAGRTVRRSADRAAGTASGATPAGWSRCGRRAAGTAATTRSASTVIGSAPKSVVMPATTPTVIVMPARPGGPKRRRPQQADSLLAIAERLGSEHARVDRLGDAGDDTEPEDADHEDRAEDHRQLVGVCTRAAGGVRHDRARDADQGRGDERRHGADLLRAAVADRAPQQPPAQSDEGAHQPAHRSAQPGERVGIGGRLADDVDEGVLEASAVAQRGGRPGGDHPSVVDHPDVSRRGVRRDPSRDSRARRCRRRHGSDRASLASCAPTTGRRPRMARRAAAVAAGAAPPPRAAVFLRIPWL